MPPRPPPRSLLSCYLSKRFLRAPRSFSQACGRACVAWTSHRVLFSHSPSAFKLADLSGAKREKGAKTPARSRLRWANTDSIKHTENVCLIELNFFNSSKTHPSKNHVDTRCYTVLMWNEPSRDSTCQSFFLLWNVSKNKQTIIYFLLKTLLLMVLLKHHFPICGGINDLKFPSLLFWRWQHRYIYDKRDLQPQLKKNSLQKEFNSFQI